MSNSIRCHLFFSIIGTFTFRFIIKDRYVWFTSIYKLSSDRLIIYDIYYLQTHSNFHQICLSYMINIHNFQTYTNFHQIGLSYMIKIYDLQTYTNFPSERFIIYNRYIWCINIYYHSSVRFIIYDKYIFISHKHHIWPVSLNWTLNKMLLPGQPIRGREILL